MSQFVIDLPSSTSIEAPISSKLTQPVEQPKSQNVVATMNVGCQLDLKTIVTRSRNSEYNPKRFSAVIMRIRDPKSTALIFKTGKIVVTGAKSEDNAWVAARKYARILQKLDFPAKFMEFKIQNMVGSVSVGFPIRLEGLSRAHSQFTSYEPELFPGLIYRMQQPHRIVLLVFVSGKIVLTGAKSMEQINAAFSKIYPVLVQFRKEQSLSMHAQDVSLAIDDSNHNHHPDGHAIDNIDIDEDHDMDELHRAVQDDQNLSVMTDEPY
eukprot:CAMPEP_0202697222 /NCGR_PEP_ID=MMETSP1385-20130828/10549_1 /ASSEMBLY_ACC=CAM_ASM_000861 /TAXON_ID=933848 /ORGANISM="Elphidium margaritaceum" /LENGTH=265 /DNA_ID=CAMNT_0049353617 /DNA_START=39 /DNA_END=836 /DNA_ORIENTATION=-